jgi:hypothetical protein
VALRLPIDSCPQTVLRVCCPSKPTIAVCEGSRRFEGGSYEPPAGFCVALVRVPLRDGVCFPAASTLAPQCFSRVITGSRRASRATAKANGPKRPTGPASRANRQVGPILSHTPSERITYVHPNTRRLSRGRTDCARLVCQVRCGEIGWHKRAA